MGTYSAFITAPLFKQLSNGATITDNSTLYFTTLLKLFGVQLDIFGSSSRSTSCWKQHTLNHSTVAEAKVKCQWLIYGGPQMFTWRLH